LKALDKSFQNLGLEGNQVAMVSDIGCSGLFDTFFSTHALHGLHGRALTYGAGLKLANPDLHVVVTMGDGGLGIGGAHFLAACRRNLNITLMVLNNFNFGMTGGQFSVTTPTDATVGSGFLNTLEKPLDVGQVAVAAGAAFVGRCSAYESELPNRLEDAVRFEGFSVLDIHGICPGRYLRRNRLTPDMIDESLKAMNPLPAPVEKNQRPEYGRSYRSLASNIKAANEPPAVESIFEPPRWGRQEVLFLGAAGQRVLTAGEVLGVAGLKAGLRVTQKNEYNITVMTGPSITELILSPEEIDFTGITQPSAVIALSEEGVARRHDLFMNLDKNTLVIQPNNVKIPSTGAQVMQVDFRNRGIKKTDWALASLALLAGMNRVLNPAMLYAALEHRFKGKILDGIMVFAKAVVDNPIPEGSSS
jgi:pyruvate/2-oxoacid:ferredoxin oxidoreductase beta subunit/Pyruvate/2-oxoacid:ferredoxin oxidoreductase gamma subunit